MVRPYLGLFLIFSLLISGNGCAALTNPVGDGIPVRRVPPELLAPSKRGELTIPLNLLGQASSPYRLAGGDVLGVYIEGILGDRNQTFPLNLGPNVVGMDQKRLPPASGYPIHVQADGTIVLPAINPLQVGGMTIAEAREVIRKTYLDKQLLRPENERIFVSLLHPRHYQVLVFRQEAANFSFGPIGTIGSSKRGTGFVVDLPAQENDILHALAKTGGLPALDALNEIIIFRDYFHDAASRDLVLQQLQTSGMPLTQSHLGPRSPQVMRIPLRGPGGHFLPPRPDEVILRTGDVVFLEARDDDLFYTGGLLPPGAHLLPRDHDLDVIEAVSLVRGPLFNGAFGGSNLSGALLQPGLGNPSPSSLVVLRRTADGRQLPIMVDLRKALRDHKERLVIRAGDVLILQESPCEAMTRYFTQTFFNFNFLWQVIRSDAGVGVLDVTTPDRLSGRLGTVNMFNR